MSEWEAYKKGFKEGLTDKWDYMTYDIPQGPIEERLKSLKRLGQKKWELVGIDFVKNIWWLKRRVVDEEG